ncbi:polyprotein [Bangui virus]|nr:polyprotein [Bangui virus]
MASFLLIALLPLVTALPLDRCFTGGSLIKESTGERGFPNICIRDDISMIRSVIHAEQRPGQKTIYTNKLYRKYLIENWRDCRPEKMMNGPLMILSMDDDGHLQSEDYICRNPCEIKIDRESGLIMLETDKLNYYQITGTTINNGWFKTSTSISLKHTCENIRLQCGDKAVDMHACFRSHMECYNFLYRGMLSKETAIAICNNIELIIILTLTLIIFGILCLLAKTYICYLLMPIFIPFTYAYSRIYKRCCKLCPNCGLVYHPFTNCGTYCICGSKYESSERMKIHRTSGLCPGYKYLRTARTLCKAKGCNFILSIILSMIFLSFISPIGAAFVSTNYNLSCLDIKEIPSEYRNTLITVEAYKTYTFIDTIILGTLLSIGTLMYLIFILKPQWLLNIYLFKCDDCNMLHSRNRLIIEEFGTSKCGSCTCGCPDEPPLSHFHQVSSLCASPYTIKLLKFFLHYVLIIAVFQIIFTGTLADLVTDCAPPNETKTDCWGKKLIDKMQTLRGNKSVKEFSKALISNPTPSEVILMESIPDGYTDFLLMADKIPSLLSRAILESMYYTNKKHQYHMIIDKSSDQYISWKIKAKLRKFHICMKSSATVCTCFKSDTSCHLSSIPLKTNLMSITITEQEYLEDIHSAVDLLHDILQPTAFQMLISKLNDFVASKISKDKLVEFLQVLMDSYGEWKRPFIQNFIALTKNILDSQKGSKEKMIPLEYMYLTDTAPSTQELVKKFESEGEDINLDNLELDLNRKTCLRAKYINCVSSRLLITHIKGLVVCDRGVETSRGLATLPRNRTLHRWSDSYVQPDRSTICNVDMTCRHNLISADESELSSLKDRDMKCKSVNFPNFTSIYNSKISECYMKEKGFCKIDNNTLQVVKCTDGTVVEQVQTGYYSDDHRLNHVCFLSGCRPTYRIHPDTLNDCSINIPRQTIDKIKTTSAISIEEFRQNLKQDFLTGLTNFKFKHTENLPHISPSYLPLTIQGTETSKGVEDSFIEFEMPALRGKSTGVQLYTKSGDYIFDIIIYIRSANITSRYASLYRTGPTISYNSVHEEKCTGRCPEYNPGRDLTWMVFAREDTSYWGCESAWCFAIAEGCLYGGCKDIIKPEAEVFKKITEEKLTIELCITSHEDSYCTIIDSGSATISNKLDAQFKTVEAFILPKLVLIREHRIFVGQINDLGEFARYCGNVQNVNGTVSGQGRPEIDYKCHAQSNKDVIIRKCYDNDYNSCLMLKEQDGISLDVDGGQTIDVGMHNKIMGTMKLKIHLGDIQYKLFDKPTTLQTAATCVGCIGCIDSISCEIEILTEIESSCEIESKCKSFINRLLITPAKKKYYLKLSCTDPEIKDPELIICKAKVETALTIIASKPVLELGSPGHTPYVSERDEKCHTWLCRAWNEGIGSIFDPLRNFFGYYWNMAVTAVVVIVALVLLIYVFLPLFMKLKDTLKKQEEAYKKEYKKY